MKTLLATALTISVVLAPHITRAQSAGGVQQYTAVLRSCAAEAARLCPAESDRRSGRNQLTCLRPYRSTLSPACRRAVTGTTG